MKKLCFLISMLLVFTLCGCGEVNPPQQNGSATAEQNSGTKAEKVSEKILTYTDVLGNPQVLYLATVKNTDTKPLEFANVTIDINDAENNLIKHVDSGIVYPRYIMPGEYGYICEECTRLDSTVDLTKVSSAEMHFGTRKADYKKPNVEITQLGLKQGSIDWNILGKVKSNEEIQELAIAFPIFDENGELQTLAITFVEGLTAGSEKGFECSPIDYDPKTDFSKSKVEAIPYIF